MEKLLEVSDLHVAFPSKRETVRAVDGVSFQVFQGETFGLVGESGCGKSQTLRSILGLLKQPGRITGGEIRYKGADIAKMSQRELQKIRGKEISMIFQEPMTALNPVLRIRSQMYEAFEGEKLSKEEKRRRAIELLKLVGIHPVVVHGGGPQIGNMLEKLEIRSEFREGLRVTDDATMNVVEMVLVGSVNKDIVNQINRAGARAVGLSGKDGMLLHAEKKAMVVTRENQPPEIIDLGNVGRVTRVETTLIFSLMKDGFVPVIAPVGVDDEGHTYNINADAVAGAVAGALRARRLIMLTDVAGVLDPEGKLIQSIRVEDAAGLYENGTVTGGMIPKLNCCIDAIEQGVEKVMIVDGRVENCVLLELLTDQGVGTEIVGEER